MSDYQKIRITKREKTGERFVHIDFSLWPNENRESETHPNLRGWDKENKIASAAWTKTYEGKKFLSGNVEVPLDKLWNYLKDKCQDDYVAPDYGMEPDDAIPF